VLRSANADGKERPPGDAADPCRLFERQSGGKRPRDEIKDAVGIGRFQKKVAAAPRRIGGMPRLGQIHGLVDVGHGPCPRRGEDRRDEQALGTTSGPARRPTVAAFTRQAVHL